MPENKYDQIGTAYNSTRKADPYLAARLIHFLEPESQKLYLDLGCGTGNYTIALYNKGINMYGVEPSLKMLNEAKKRNDKITWITGRAENIPTANAMFRGVIATLTVHHWTHLQKAFAEIGRVLTGDGKLVVFTSAPEQMKGYWLNHYFPKMMLASIMQMPSPDQLLGAAEKTGFEMINSEPYFVSDNLEDHFLYVGKNKPELYFDAAIRNGISSFTSLSHISEVEEGLKKLRSDLDDKTFERIRKSYDNNRGDYIFMTLKKRQHA